MRVFLRIVRMDPPFGLVSLVWQSPSVAGRGDDGCCSVVYERERERERERKLDVFWLVGWSVELRLRA